MAESRASQARKAVAAAVEAAGLTVVDHVPSVITPPLVILGTADPYITPGDTFGHELVANFELYAIAGTGENDQELNELELMVEAIAAQIDFTAVSAPAMWAASGSYFLASKITTAVLYG